MMTLGVVVPVKSIAWGLLEALGLPTFCTHKRVGPVEIHHLLHFLQQSCDEAFRAAPQ